MDPYGKRCGICEMGWHPDCTDTECVCVCRVKYRRRQRERILGLMHKSGAVDKDMWRFHTTTDPRYVQKARTRIPDLVPLEQCWNCPDETYTFLQNQKDKTELQFAVCRYHLHWYIERTPYKWKSATIPPRIDQYIKWLRELYLVTKNNPFGYLWNLNSPETLRYYK